VLKTFLQHFAEKIRASAWTIPALLSISAVLLAQFALWADQKYPGPTLPFLSWFENSSPAGTRAFLATIATSMLAIAGVSFSSIMVTMALASQQFGPRLLRNFIKDKFSQTVLGTLIGTFVYCIFVIRRVQTTEEGLFVPQLSTFVALILALLSLATFIRFIHHIISVIQAEEVVSDAYDVLETTIDTVFPDLGDDNQEHRIPGNELTGWFINCGKTGYVQAVDMKGLVKVAREFGVILATNVSSGHFVSENQAVLRVVESPDSFDEEIKLTKKVQKCFFIGPVGTPEQDFEYGIRQLVEVALRALSPGINDPFTAMNCIDYLGAGLQSAFARPLPGSIHRDTDGNIRLFSWRNSYRGLVEASVNQIRQESRERCDVSCRLLEMLTETAKLSKNEEQQAALLVQAELINLNTQPLLHNDHDRESIRERFARFVRSCHYLDPIEDA